MGKGKTTAIQRLGYYALSMCLLLGAYGTLVEPQTLDVVEWPVQPEKSTNRKDLKIAVISDFHMVWPWMTPAHLDRIVARVNETKPDMVMLLGDYAGTDPFGLQLDPDAAFAPLQKLSAPCGVYAVLGNHDLYEPQPHKWPEALRRTGIPVLENRAVPQTCNGEKYWVAGLAEIWRQTANAQTTLAQVTDGSPVIMMVHNPDAFAAMPDRVTLTVAGHTHGGQVRLPFIGAVEAVIPSQYGKRYLYGHIRENGKDLVVTSGLGMSGLPIRFMTPPEIAVITLKANAAPQIAGNPAPAPGP